MSITLELGLLADYAQADDKGKLHIVGEFRYLWAPQFPTFHPRMTLVLRLSADSPSVKGRNPKLRLQFTDQDGTEIIPSPGDLPINFGPVGPLADGESNAQVIVNLENTPIPRAGKYVVNVWVDGKHLGGPRFQVQQTPAGKSP